MNGDCHFYLHLNLIVFEWCLYLYSRANHEQLRNKLTQPQLILQVQRRGVNGTSQYTQYTAVIMNRTGSQDTNFVSKSQIIIINYQRSKNIRDQLRNHEEIMF